MNEILFRKKLCIIFVKKERKKKSGVNWTAEEQTSLSHKSQPMALSVAYFSRKQIFYLFILSFTTRIF